MVRITHPFHPWHGRAVELFDHRNVVGVERVLLEDADGLRTWIPAAWTDIGPVDPFLAVSEGRSPFRVEDLVRLVELVSEVARCPAGQVSTK